MRRPLLRPTFLETPVNNAMKAVPYIALLAAGVVIGALVANRFGPGAAGSASAPAPATAGAPAAPANAVAGAGPGPMFGEPAAVGLEDIRGLLAFLPPAQGKAVVEDPTAFKRFVDGEGALRSLIAAARANNLQNNPTIAGLMRRQGERILVETYLSELVRKTLGADFPKPEQVRKIFDDNRDKFAVPDQVHVWQIFWPAAADAPAAARAAAEKESNAVAADLRAGRISFADAAARYSRHQASRFSGGYMGLLQVNDLLPEVRTVVADLPEDEISKPVRTASGYHLVKRGAIVPGRKLEFTEVEAQARELLLREAGAKVREQITAKARETYRLQAPDDQIESWRKTLAATPAKAG